MEKEAFRKRFFEILDDSERIVITSHSHPTPDHDAVSSTLALSKILKSKGYESQIIFTQKSSPSFLEYLDKENEINWSGEIREFLDKNDTVIFLDGSRYELFSADDSEFDIKHSICIDHHPNESDEFEIRYCENEGLSTCEIIADMFDYDTTDKDIAYLLTTGILADTGFFRWTRKSNNIALERAYKVVKDTNIEFEDIYLKIHKQDKSEFQKFQILVKNTRFVELKNGQKFVCSFLTKEDSKGVGKIITEKYQLEVTRMIHGYDWGFIMFFHHGEGVYTFSFRSKTGGPNVSKLANQYFNGGGHARASGGWIPDEEGSDTEEMLEKIIQQLENVKFEING